MQPVDKPSANIFKFVGDFWLLQYADQEVYARNCRGMRSFQSLIRQQDRPVDILTLDGPLHSHRTKRPSDVEDLSIINAGPIPEPTIDQKGLQQIKDKLLWLKEERETADTNNDLGRLDHLNLEIEKLGEYLRQNMKPNGSARMIQSEVEAARKRVYAAIRYARDRVIYPIHKPLWRHLKDSVFTGRHCRYSPPEPTDWTF